LLKKSFVSLSYKYKLCQLIFEMFFSAVNTSVSSRRRFPTNAVNAIYMIEFGASSLIRKTTLLSQAAAQILPALAHLAAASHVEQALHSDRLQW
jgi:hypothetical protein